MTHVGQPKILKWYNSDLVERLIWENDAITKPELAAATNLSLQTVNKIVDRLVMEEKVLEGSTQTGSGVGRPARVYTANPDYGTLIMVYYADGRWIGRVVNLCGREIVYAERQAAEGKSMDFIYKLIDEIKLDAKNVLTIGLGIPGVVLSDGRVTSIPALNDLDGVNPKAMLRERYNVRVVVENDVKLMTVGWRTKELTSIQNMMFIYVEDRIGAGVIISGQLYKGFGSFSGELGYMPCVSCGTGDALYHNGGEMENSLAHAREDGDNEMFCRLIGQTIAGSCAVINPEAVVIYSGNYKMLSKEKIEREVARYIPQYGRPALYVTYDSSYEYEGLFELCRESARERCWLTGAITNKGNKG